MNSSLLNRGHLSSESIDLLLLSALPSHEAQLAHVHLESCASCKAQWQTLSDDQKRFEQFVFPRTLPTVQARVDAERSGFFGQLRWTMWVPALGVAAALVMLVFKGQETRLENDGYVGIKGQPTLEIFAIRGDGGPFAVGPGVPLHPKDRIRFVVSPAGAKYLLVASRDGAGTFSIYHPFGAQQSQALNDMKARLDVPGAVELDETLGPERVVAVFSEEPVMAEQVEAALRADEKNPKLPGVRFVSFEFVKVAP